MTVLRVAKKRILVPALLVVALASAAGCAGSLLGVNVALRTADAPADACMLALMSGTLAANPQSGLGIDGSEAPIAVEWPFGYSARNELGKLVLLDETGKVLAREGDEVEIGGGFGANDIWHACAGVTVMKPAT
jgi:hypothetical protein